MSDIHPYFPEKWPKMNHPREFCMAKLVVISKVSHMRVTVETYEGMIRAVRCQKPPGLIITEPYQIKISTTGGPITDNIATELNAMEHPEER